MRVTIYICACPVICACTFLAACAKQPAAGTHNPGTATVGDPSRVTRGSPPAGCRELPNADDLKEYLRRAPAEGGDAGGMFAGKLEWAAIVNRNGEICAAAVSSEPKKRRRVGPSSRTAGSNGSTKNKSIINSAVEASITYC